ncbi:tetratricopeptide repeat protein [Streptomyces botrytidirepellens]|uniref:Tetratricopeptide repeat protein n=1 Tax=Streptomyces botrytidirepellens TaxID=2486417 RepID=A0A3M8VYY5_9ACTN|nr:tetratricopeptide repeat protein [Streptomyces botrytidirepellens]RNG21651.1 tetratricopeptide repeat protein [Streptomyces botrytidirepellens]
MKRTRWIAIGLGIIADSRDIGRLLKQHPDRVSTGRDWLLREEERDDDTRNLRNTALWQRRSGNAADAVGSYERLVAVRARAWGADHSLVLDTRLSLAGVRAEAGDVAEAVETYEHVLADTVRVLGEDHRGTRWTRHRLTQWRGDNGARRVPWTVPTSALGG